MSSLFLEDIFPEDCILSIRCHLLSKRFRHIIFKECLKSSKKGKNVAKRKSKSHIIFEGINRCVLPLKFTYTISKEFNGSLFNYMCPKEVESYDINKKARFKQNKLSLNKTFL